MASFLLFVLFTLLPCIAVALAPPPIVRVTPQTSLGYLSTPLSYNATGVFLLETHLLGYLQLPANNPPGTFNVVSFDYSSAPQQWNVANYVGVVPLVSCSNPNCDPNLVIQSSTYNNLFALSFATPCPIQNFPSAPVYTSSYLNNWGGVSNTFVDTQVVGYCTPQNAPTNNEAFTWWGPGGMNIQAAYQANPGPPLCVTATQVGASLAVTLALAVCDATNEYQWFHLDALLIPQNFLSYQSVLASSTPTAVLYSVGLAGVVVPNAPGFGSASNAGGFNIIDLSIGSGFGQAAILLHPLANCPLSQASYCTVGSSSPQLVAIEFPNTPVGCSGGNKNLLNVWGGIQNEFQGNGNVVTYCDVIAANNEAWQLVDAGIGIPNVYTIRAIASFLTFPLCLSTASWGRGYQNQIFGLSICEAGVTQQMWGFAPNVPLS